MRMFRLGDHHSFWTVGAAMATASAFDDVTVSLTGLVTTFPWSASGAAYAAATFHATTAIGL